MSPPLNIILKGFHGHFGNMMVGEAFRDRPIGTCISLTDEKITPPFSADKHLWMSARALRLGRYPGIDWNTITPLDEELMEKMSKAETIFLSMVERYALHGDMTYARRKRQYLQHLRYWNHVLETEKIGLFLLFTSPHQCYDYVIYELCKLKGIPVYNLEHCCCLPGFFLTSDFERSAEELGPAFEQLKQEYANPKKPIPLEQSFETFFQAASTMGSPPRRPKIDESLRSKSFIRKWKDKSLGLLQHKPRKFFLSALSPQVWSRKIHQHRTALFYDEHTTEPDFTKPYIYAPLHLQPEDAVIPRGGAFMHQELTIQMLAACLPPGVSIYIKEHPMQGELYRSETFYRSMLELPQVIFVPRSTDTFQLIRHSKAVATITGTAGFEAPFFGKPTLMFGHRFYQYAPGVHRIRTTEDCKNALQSIFEKEETPQLRDLRIFLKAVEECSVFFYEKHNTPEQKAVQDDQVRAMGQKIRDTLDPLFV
jgi:hypothetical protein